MKLDFPFGEIFPGTLSKPKDMVDYSSRKMDEIRDLLRAMPDYRCSPSCSRCCHGAILMSYVEYIGILAHIGENCGEEYLQDLILRLGTLQDEGKLLCPFLDTGRANQHCTLYNARPLICRIFGTTAAPCDENIEYPHFPEILLYQAYDRLAYFDDGNQIGLPLTDDLVLYEAPFDIWAIADSGRTDELLRIFKEHGSLRAVLFDLKESRYFVLKGGERHYLD